MEVFALVSLALVAGAVLFSSPCVLPLLPGYVSYVSGLCGTSSGGGARASGLGLAQQRRVRFGAGLFVAGFATVFTVLGRHGVGAGADRIRQRDRPGFWGADDDG